MSNLQFRPTGFQLLPEVVKNLLIINGLFFLATVVLESSMGIDLIDMLGLHYFDSEKFRWYQLITYMFMHGNFMHVFFNMFAVWMFGSAIENLWGSKKFLTYYLITGIGAALTHYVIIYLQIHPAISQFADYINDPQVDKLAAILHHTNFGEYIHPNYTPDIYASYVRFKKALMTLQFNPSDRDALNTTVMFMSEYLEYFKNIPNVVGASGSLFGILLAFGMMFPNSLVMLIFFPIPIKAKYFVIIYGLVELFSGLRDDPGDNVAHFAHLGGMLFGFFLIKYWNRRKNQQYFN